MATTIKDTFPFPPHHSFPPFFTLQPNQSTLSRQLTLWSSLITSYCSHHHIFTLSTTSSSVPATNHPSASSLFANPKINRTLDPLAISTIMTHMTSSSPPTAEYKPHSKTEVWIWYKTPSEFGDAIAAWVDETGQKGVVLTIYELRESDAVSGKEWTGMDEDMLRKVLDGLVKRGKAQVFGQAGGAGVKFF